MGTLVYLSLGGNLGNRERYIQKAIDLISKETGTILRVSKFYESEPWGFDTNSQFLNICAALETNLTPLDLLHRFQEIEKELGRKEKTSQGYASRVIDIDILTYGDRIIENENLTVPHPQMEKRKFVLLPLVEIAPDFTHPKTTKSIQQIIATTSDESSVLVYESK